MGLVLAAFTWAYAIGPDPGRMAGGSLRTQEGSRCDHVVVGHRRGHDRRSSGSQFALQRALSSRLGRSRRLPGGQPGHAALVSAIRTRPHSRHHAFLQPVCCRHHSVRCGQYHARLRLARDFLYFRIAWRNLGHGFFILLSEPPGRSQECESCGARSHPRLESGRHSPRSEHLAAAGAMGNEFSARRICGSSRWAMLASFLEPIFI